MTVNTVNTIELTIDRIVLRAHQLAGLTPAETGSINESRAGMARDFLEMEVDALQATGTPLMRAVSLYAVDITSGTETYNMPAGTLDVIGRAMFAEDGETTETPVVQMSREDFQGISTKDSTGRPTRMYVVKGGTVTITLWPVPDANGTLTVQQHSLLADCNDGSKTLDLERHWTLALTLALAARLAQQANLPPAKISMLLGEAKQALSRARAQSIQSGASRLVINHGPRS